MLLYKRNGEPCLRSVLVVTRARTQYHFYVSLDENKTHLRLRRFKAQLRDFVPNTKFADIHNTLQNTCQKFICPPRRLICTKRAFFHLPCSRLIFIHCSYISCSTDIFALNFIERVDRLETQFVFFFLFKWGDNKVLLFLDCFFEIRIYSWFRLTRCNSLARNPGSFGAFSLDCSERKERILLRTSCGRDTDIDRK